MKRCLTPTAMVQAFAAAVARERVDQIDARAADPKNANKPRIKALRHWTRHC